MKIDYEFSKLQAQSFYYESTYDTFIQNLRKLRSKYNFSKCVYNNQIMYIRDIFTENGIVMIVIGKCENNQEPKHISDIHDQFSVQFNEVIFNDQLR